MERTPWTFDGLIDGFCQRIDPVGIVMSGTSVLDVVPHLETLETLSASIVDVLGIGNELRGRRRSIGGRHFE